MGWLVVVFLVSGSMFFLGILVGRGTAPLEFDIDKLSHDLSTLRQTFAIESFATPPESLSDEPELEFFDALKHKKNMGEDDLAIKIKKQKPLPKPKKEGEEVNTEIAQTALPPATIGRVTSERKTDHPSETPSAPVPPVDDDGNTDRSTITIQVAAFKQAEDADRLVRELTGLGYPAYKSVGNLSDSGTWFRVRIGEYADRKAASATLAQLKRDNINGFLSNK